MTLDLAISLALYAFASSITPGPNNLMLLASGANFGARRSIPHMAGVALGFLLLMFMVGAGLSQIFAVVPAAHGVLKVLALLFMGYMAFKIAFSTPNMGETANNASPITFWQAIAFQWINPKAIGMAITATTAYVPEGSGIIGLVAAVLVFGSVNCPCVNVWMLAGTQIRAVLNTSARVRAFNITAAVLLLVSAYPILVASNATTTAQAQVSDTHFAESSALL